MQPFLFQFKVKRDTLTQQQVADELRSLYKYDSERGMLLLLADGTPVVESNKFHARITKKHDIEKSEDAKDRWI